MKNGTKGGDEKGREGEGAGGEGGGARQEEKEDGSPML